MYLNQKTKYACKPKAKWPNKKKKKKLQRRDRERRAILEGGREREKWQRERGFGVTGEAVVVVNLCPTVVTNLLISA